MLIRQRSLINFGGYFPSISHLRFSLEKSQDEVEGQNIYAMEEDTIERNSIEWVSLISNESVSRGEGQARDDFSLSHWREISASPSVALNKPLCILPVKNIQCAPLQNNHQHLVVIDWVKYFTKSPKLCRVTDVDDKKKRSWKRVAEWSSSHACIRYLKVPQGQNSNK